MGWDTGVEGPETLSMEKQKKIPRKETTMITWIKETKWV